jgi:hypothetical protein
MAGRTYYEVLRVSPGATEDEIKEAYRALAWKPDATSQDELKAVNEAYATLSSPSRREAYDRSLAEGTAAASIAVAPATAAAAPAAGRPAPAAVETEEERIPKGPAFLRFWGSITEMSLGFRRAKYYFVPYTWIICALLVGFGVYLWTEYSDTVANTVPDKVTIQDLNRRVPDRKYISVTGTSPEEWAYSLKDTPSVRYYWLFDGDDVLLYRGDNRTSGNFTGLLRSMDGELKRFVEEDAGDAAKEGITVLTTYYLDTNFHPKTPGFFYAGFVFVAFGLVALIVPSLHRYAVFRAEHGSAGQAVYPNTEWPIPVVATGRFRPEAGRGLPHFDALHPSLVSKQEDGGHKVLAQFDKGRYYQILIPPGSETQIGLDHTGGHTKAGLRVRAGGQTIYLRVASMKQARQLAAAFEETR